jgi:diadenylate cyclase
MQEYIKSLLEGVNLSLWSVTSIQLTDVLDILLMAYLIYVLISWIQQTRAWSVFKGIIVIILLMALSSPSMLRLNAIYWLISNAFSVGIIALIVLFQPELRRALEQIGRAGGYFTGGSQELSKNTVEEIISASKSMAKVKTGALIVLERHVPLGDLVSTGISVDAAVSAELLINIFEKNTPLHDGAVIIRNNRVAAATCILPLTDQDLDSELGTRHRAAIGTCEQSDAYVIVVSEETGKISVARAGKLYRGLTGQQSYDLLLEGVEETEKKNFLERRKASR